MWVLPHCELCWGEKVTEEIDWYRTAQAAVERRGLIYESRNLARSM